ncbi:toprim domain-containing protein [Chryseobacterium sp.]|uniref:toprim domain-containing protein n=1 Tax=Chryseobacterium sp. TaxID=1871047 RepID=UPI00333F8486
MNCKQLNSIGLKEVLAALGHLPARQNEKEAWYPNPFASENQASFKIDKQKNVWYLFSEGIGGTTTDFIQKYYNTSVKGALAWASEQNFSSFHQQTKPLKPSSNYHIDRIMDIAHPNLILYLHERGLTEKVYPFIKELWFTIENKQLYAVGFKNRSDGWELRNAFYKGALNKKDITTLTLLPENESINTNITSKEARQKVAVFEGFTDALSFIEMQTSFHGDLLVLNSVAMIQRAIDVLIPYSEISLFLDNDKSGRDCTNMILKSFPHAKDFSHLYSNQKDLNQYLIEKKQRKAFPAQNARNAPKNEAGNAEQQEDCNKETRRIKKGARRRM